ncbi:arginase [Tissierella carlieri]|uniref:arginase n=1 Tax=Tissierella carlieri TaxID=689904 RepID=UPI001C1070CC|nr:arginase [Tissierella carlieri]MBU5311434.1 arginase [Tissierella carlieri]MDU5080679.1 arginase [Bacillota bacterium]
MDINLIGVPLKYGCDRDGAQLGPATLRENGIIDIIKKNGHNVHDMGDIYIPYVVSEDKYKDHPKMKYLNTVAEVNSNLANNVYCSLKGQSFPFIIGGDHALGAGSIAGASKFFKNMAVIWIDAHGDINTYETSPSGNIHGMPLAASMNVGHPALTNIYYDGIKVIPQNVYILGGRDIDSGEFALADELNLNMYTMDIVRERGLDNVLEEIVEKIKASNVDGVHISFDIDVLDSSLVPGTGTPVAGGFSIEEGKEIFTTLLGEKFITSMDFVELNPKIDNEDKRTTKNCIEMLEHIFSTMHN